MIPQHYTQYTSGAQDRLIEDLDVKDSTRKELISLLEFVAEAAYQAGYKQAEEDKE
jgi:hypothetical protein